VRVLAAVVRVLAAVVRVLAAVVRVLAAVVRALAVVVRALAVVVRALAVVSAALARARVPAGVRVMAARVGAQAQGRLPVVARRAVLPEPGRWAPALARGRQEAAPMPGWPDLRREGPGTAAVW
jgi:hypothetical protein